MARYLTPDGIEVDAVFFDPEVDDLPDAVDTTSDPIDPVVLRNMNATDPGTTASLPTINGDAFGNIVVDPEGAVVDVAPVAVWVVTFPDGTVKLAHPSVFDDQFKAVK